MNGLEAIELMKQGKIVTDGKREYRISDGKITVLTYVVRNDMGTGRELWENVEYFNTAKDSYEEYIEPKTLTGWERVDKTQTFYYINGFDSVNNTIEANYEIDKTTYEKANYFSTEEKAEEINFKQTLLRKLQRFSDENGGNEIDWENTNQKNTVFYIATALKNCGPILLGFAKIKDKFTSFQKKSQKKPSCYSMMN